MRRNFDKRAKNFVLQQARPNELYDRPFHRTEKKSKKSTAMKKVISFIKAIFTKLEPWQKQAIQDAKDKRARRLARNVAWWANDRTWEYSPLFEGNHE